MNVYSVTNAAGHRLSRYEVNDLLEELGISDKAIEKGTESAIEADAKKNKVDLTKLTLLAKKEGAELNGSAGTTKEDFKAKLESLGIPEKTIKEGKEAVKAYALQHNIELPKPPNGAHMNAIG